MGAARLRKAYLDWSAPAPVSLAGLLALCERIAPLLRVKGEQARLTAEMQRTMSTKRTGLPIALEVVERREELRRAIAEEKHGPGRTWGGRQIA